MVVLGKTKTKKQKQKPPLLYILFTYSLNYSFTQTELCVHNNNCRPILFPRKPGPTVQTDSNGLIRQLLWILILLQNMVAAVIVPLIQNPLPQYK